MDEEVHVGNKVVFLDEVLDHIAVGREMLFEEVQQ